MKHGLLGWLQCFSSCCLVVKPFSHEAHRYGRSPVCVRTCRTMVVVYTVEYEQNWHTSRGARGSCCCCPGGGGLPPVVPVCRGEVVAGSLLLQAKVVDHGVLPGKRLAADTAVKAAAA